MTWVSKLQMQEIIGNTMTHLILQNMNSKTWVGKLFYHKTKDLYVDEWHWKAKRNVKVRRELRFIPLEDTIKSFKHLVANGDSRHIEGYKAKLKALEKISEYIKKDKDECITYSNYTAEQTRRCYR